MMMAIVMTTGVALATEFDVSERTDGSTYNKTYTGSNSEFTAKATYIEACVTLENTASSSRYLECSVTEYKINVGRTDYKTTSNTVLSDVQISTEIERDTALIGYYAYAGYCKYNQYASGYSDSYYYKANQQWD